MGIYILRPAGDSKSQWTEQPIGSAWSILNEAVTEADTPDTSDNYVDVTASGQINRQSLETMTLALDEIVTRIEGWWYMRTATTGQTVEIDVLGTPNSVALSIPAGTAYGWQLQAYTFDQPITQTVLDGFVIQAVSQGTATVGSSRVAAEFLRVYTASEWTPHRMPMA